MPPFPDPQGPLSDGTVTLRLAAPRDIPEILIAYQDDPRLHLHLGIERPPSGAELGRSAERAQADRAAGRHVTFTILEPGSDVCRGQIHTPEVDWRHARADIGMWLAPQVRGRGLAPKALRLAARWLLDSARLRRLQILTEPDNEPMVATAIAAGFVPEGLLRGYTLERGARVDCAILSLLPTDLERMTQEWRVKLPPGVRQPFEVYVNGVPQELGADYHVSAGELVFERELVRQKLGLWAWFLGFWGIGTYKRNDEVDVRYEVEGRPTVAHGLEITPPS